jgi:lipoprotein-anchoring transpeptidase ErfK/SrfK
MKHTVNLIVRRTSLAASLLIAPMAAQAANLEGANVERQQILVEAVQTAQFQPAPQVQAVQVQPGLGPDATFLDPGKYVWRPDPAASGPVRVVVSLPLQIAYVFKGQKLIGASSVSTGMPGYDTPPGAFTILEKKVDHKSNLYEDAPMPFMQRLTWDGVALHAGKVTGQPVSHGCVRLPAAFARKLFGETSVGATVLITDEAPLAAEQALALVPGGDMLASR